MKTINAITLLQLLENAKSNNVMIENESNSIVNYKNVPVNYRPYVKGVVTGTYRLGLDYQQTVNQRLVENGQKGDFKAGSRPWGKWIIPNVALEYCGKVYIRAYYNNANDLSVTYKFLGGDMTENQKKEMQVALGRGFAKRVPAQEEKGLAESDNLLMRVIRVDSIHRIVIDNEEYFVK